jgi:hypothetical protein
MPGEISIVHCEGSSPPLFRLAGTPDDPPSPVPVPSPYEFPVEGQPHSNLMRELRWYLEHFLDYPFDPETMTSALSEPRQSSPFLRVSVTGSDEKLAGGMTTL